MNDCLLAVDLFGDFGHEDGARLLQSLRERQDGFTRALDGARKQGIPVLFACATADERIEATALEYLEAVTGTRLAAAIEDAW